MDATLNGIAWDTWEIYTIAKEKKKEKKENSLNLVYNVEEELDTKTWITTELKTCGRM